LKKYIYVIVYNMEICEVENLKVDSQEAKILNLLKENSRMSQKEIAETLGLSRPTVKSKMERLVEEGVIDKFTVKLGREVVEENIILFVNTSSVNKEVLAREEVVEAYRVSGRESYLLKAVVRNMEEARRLTQRLEELCGEANVEISLENLKREEESPLLKAEYACEYCGSTTREPRVFKLRNVEHYFCCPICLKNYRRALKAR